MNGAESMESSAATKPMLKLVGSCRHEEDEKRLEALRRSCRELGIEDDVEILKNVSYRLVDLLGSVKVVGND